MKKFFLYLSVIFVHAAVSVNIFLWSFKLEMQRFDSGETETQFEIFLSFVSNVLFFPIVHLSHMAPKGIFSGLVGYIPVLLNSFLWAYLLIFIYKKLNAKST